MVSWAEFAAAAPEMAELGQALWKKNPIAYLATVRKDAGPRVHPFCPIIVGGRLFAAIPESSPKAGDLRRDKRYMVHALPGQDDAEFSIRGRATEVREPGIRARVVAAASSIAAALARSAERDLLFEFGVEQADTAVWERVGQPGTRSVRRRWRA